MESGVGHILYLLPRNKTLPMVFCLTWLLLLHIEELYNCIMPSITAPETFLLDGFQQDRDRSRSCFPNTPWCTELQLSRFRLEQTLYYVVDPLDLYSNSGAINRWRQSTENLKNRFGLKIFFYFSVLLFYFFDLFSLKEIPLASFWFCCDSRRHFYEVPLYARLHSGDPELLLLVAAISLPPQFHFFADSPSHFHILCLSVSLIPD
jgi:hypothetical protein